MTRDEQVQWAVGYLASNLSEEDVESAETSITVQAFADFFAAQWPRTFNKMHFAAMVRRERVEAMEMIEAQIDADLRKAKKDPSVQMFDRMFTLPRR
jgi:hypothetical protein